LTHRYSVVFGRLKMVRTEVDSFDLRCVDSVTLRYVDLVALISSTYTIDPIAISNSKPSYPVEAKVKAQRPW
jgi:hypothetical protein